VCTIVVLLAGFACSKSAADGEPMPPAKATAKVTDHGSVTVNKGQPSVLQGGWVGTWAHLATPGGHFLVATVPGGGPMSSVPISPPPSNHGGSEWAHLQAGEQHLWVRVNDHGKAESVPVNVLGTANARTSPPSASLALPTMQQEATPVSAVMPQPGFFSGLMEEKEGAAVPELPEIPDWMMHGTFEDMGLLNVPHTVQ
jgi:hypothetical protein